MLALLHRALALVSSALLSCTFLYAFCMQALALDPHTSLAAYPRQTWSTENGLPQNSVHSILQTADGYLWLGTEAGLVRFNGYQFRVFDRASTPRLPGDDIRALLGDSAGALWVGTSAGLTRLHNERARTFSAADGIPGGAVRTILETDGNQLWVLTTNGLAVASLANIDTAKAPFHSVSSDSGIGSIAADTGRGLWVGTSQGLFHVVNGRVQAGPAALAAANIELLLSTKDGLLIASSNGLMRLQNGNLTTLRSREALPAGGVRLLLETDEGIWAAGRGSVELIGPRDTRTFATGSTLPGTQITALKQDHRGVMWIGTNAGLARYAHGQMESSPSETSGASAVLTISEDHEGDIWVGTETAGVTILRDRIFQILHSAPESTEASPTSVLQAANGDVWIGSNGAGVTHIHADDTTTLTTQNGLISDTVLALGSGGPHPEDVWVGTPDGLNLLHDGHAQTFTSADGLADDFVRSLLPAHDGALWIGSRHGVTRWKNGAATIFTREQGLGSDLVGPMLEDTHKDVWIGTSGGLTRIRAGALHTYTVADGLPGNTIAALSESASGGFWIGTDGGGLSKWDGSRFLNFSKISEIPRTVYSALEDGAGSLWLTSDHGIFRVSIAQLNRFQENGNSQVSVVPYSTADGLPSMETTAGGSPAAWKLADGRLCFTTRHGVVAVGPSPRPESLPAPHIALEEITIDDRSATRAEAASLPPGASHFSFSFAGINFAAPQRVQYRYRMQGMDPTWIDAGTRRVAYYTNIGHGHYVFLVSARNAGGPWSQPAELPLSIRPYAYQTLWFRVLAACLLGALGFAIYGLRVRTLQGRFNAVTAERSRLAREIHDTLAQSFVAVSVRLEVMSQLLRAPEGIAKCREQLDQTRALVRESLEEARRSIWDLRAEGADSQSLPSRLARLAQHARSQIHDVQLQTTGTYRPLPRTLEDELFRIAGEATNNAMRHARAQTLRLALSYSLERLSLEVIDDGRGFDVELAPSRSEGHFGLTGIEERARILGAGVEWESAPGRGTSLRVSVPLPPNASPGKEGV